MDLFIRCERLGWDPRSFGRLLGLFEHHNQKLNGAAIPLACLEMYEPNQFSRYAEVLQVHSCGLSHLDYGETGTLAEFGQNRSNRSARRSLEQSRHVSENLFRNIYYPAFAPPWNNLSGEFVPLLSEVGFRTISYAGEANKGRIPQGSLYEFNFSLDFHDLVSKSKSEPEKLMAGLMNLGQSRLGISIDHSVLNEPDFSCLDRFLGLLNESDVTTRFLSEIETQNYLM